MAVPDKMKVIKNDNICANYLCFHVHMYIQRIYNKNNIYSKQISNKL